MNSLFAKLIKIAVAISACGSLACSTISMRDAEPLAIADTVRGRSAEVELTRRLQRSRDLQTAGADLLPRLVSKPSAHPGIVEGTLSPLDRDSLLVEIPGREAVALPLADIRSIHYIDHGKGARDGAIAGGVAGLLGGTLLGLAAVGLGCDEDYYPARCPPAFKTAAPFAVVGALLGAGIGAGLGAVIGHRVTLKF
ncbi:MAG TPA: hypothetical protein VF550_20045 [Polyangia bacterium]